MLKGRSTEEMRGGSMLEEFGRKMECWTSTRLRTAKREAFKGISAQLEWRRVRRSEKNNIRKW